MKGLTFLLQRTYELCFIRGWSILTSLSMADVNGGLCGMEYSQFLNGSYSVTTASTTLDVGDSSITLLSETTLYALHPPWRIAWDKKDTPTLTPQPPTLVSCASLYFPSIDIH